MSEFKLEIITPKAVFFSGFVSSLCLKTQNGELGVLKGHQTMTASLEDECLIKFKVKEDWKEACIFEAFAEVRPDETIVFAKDCEWPENVAKAKAQHEKEIALEKQRYANSLTEQKHNQISLARRIAEHRR